MRNLLIGAALALIAQGFLQLVVVPRVDARRRREDRWEQDVLALGVLLTHQLPQAISTAYHEVWWAGLLMTGAVDVPSPERLVELITESRNKSDLALDALRDLDTRMDWLVDRVLAIAPRHLLIRGFHQEAMQVGLMLSDFRGQYWHVQYEPETFEEKRLEAARDRATEHLNELVGWTKTLAALQTAPRYPLWNAWVELWRERALRRWERWRHPELYDDSKPPKRRVPAADPMPDDAAPD